MDKTILPSFRLLVAGVFKVYRNKLGHFIKISEAIIRGKYTSFTWICVEMDLSGALPDEIILEVYDEEWCRR